MCIGCDKRLTIEHILLTCSDLIEIRECHFTAKSLRMLFQDISTTNFKNPKHIGGSSFTKCGLKKKKKNQCVNYYKRVYFQTSP